MCQKKPFNLEMTKLQFIIKFSADDHSDNMAIPMKLVSTSEELAKLDKYVYLVGPSGNSWKVKLLKSEGHMYFEEGWKEFIQDHDVREDDRLVFKYLRISCFTVLLFDKGGCEKESSYFARNRKSSASNKQLNAYPKYISQSSEHNECSFTDSDNHDVTQLSSDDDSSSNSFYSSETFCSKKETWPDQRLKLPPKVKDCIDFSSPLRSCLKPRKMITKNGMKMGISKSVHRALRFADSISKINPYFFKVIPESSISEKKYLIVPQSFVVKCKLFKLRPTKLVIPHKKEWIVKYVYRSGCWVLMWHEFAKDNRLKKGDACVFELIEYRPNIIMNVHIFRC